MLEREHKVLTCVMPKGVGVALLRRLADELGVVTASVHSARGYSGSDPRGVFNRLEKDVLTLSVPAARGEEIFAWIYREAEVSTRRGSFLYIGPLYGATPFELPADVPPEQG